MHYLKKYLILPSTSDICYIVVFSTNDVDNRPDMMLFQKPSTKLLNGALATIPWGIDCNAVHVRFRTLNNIPLHVFLNKFILFPLEHTRYLGLNALSGSVPKELGKLTNLIAL
jgi:hypothetical protein